MSIMRSSNPALRAFAEPQRVGDAPARSSGSRAVQSNTMTVGGTVTATGILVGICSATAIGSWALVSNPANAGLTMPLIFGGLIAGLVFGLIISFKPRTAPFLAPIYAVFEGLFLGAFSLIVSRNIPQSAGGGGADNTIVFQAIGLTFGVAAVMLIAYGTRIIRPGRIFRSVVISATGGIMLFYVVAMVGSLFGFKAMSGLLSFDNASPLSIGISLFVVGIASLNLVLDFEFIEKGANRNLPKYMEWYGGFALLVTLVWLYIELLRLLSKLRNR